MMKTLLKIRENEKGTALLVALLVMGVLIAISLALSGLILRESRSTKELIDAGRAYYAAESAVEEALYYLDTRLPGWGTDQTLGKVSDNAVFEYEVKNKCNAYPCFDSDEYNLGSMLAHNFYDVLDLNESITIPLFTVNEDGDIDPVIDFTVEFYTNFDPTRDLKINISQVSGWDVLRWKVFGMRETAGEYVTESLHDFTAVSALNDIGTDESFNSNADSPSWFGSISCIGQDDRITQEIECAGYAFTAYAGSQEEQNLRICDQMQARDYYLYSGGEFVTKQSCYPIDQFMTRHQVGSAEGGTGLNYLSLTNLMNPMMLKDNTEGGPEDPFLASKIYFRVETYGKDMPREFADIVADGYSGDAKQSIQVKMKRDSYMPVFNFSLYSTYKDGSVEFYDEYHNPQGQQLP